MRKNNLVLLLVIICIIVTFYGCTNNKKNIRNSSRTSEKSEAENRLEEYNPIIMLINDDYLVEESFIPGNLEVVNIPFSGASSEEEMYMEYEAKKALEELFSSALADGIELYGVSGYRSYSLQQQIYDMNLANNGQEYTNNYVAIPGRSEHQIGLAMDLGDAEGNLIKNGLEVEWISNNAHLYGFILRYPKGKEDITGYKYEPWHIRYLGVSVATEIHNNNITLEEYYLD